MNKRKFVTVEVITWAFKFVRPVARRFLEINRPNGTIYFTVLDDEGEVLFREAVGEQDPNKWEHPFASIAIQKADLARRSGKNTRDLKPTEVQVGDTVHIGGVNCEGLPIGVSGVQGHFDEMFAKMLGAAIIAMAYNDLKIWKKDHPDAETF